MLCASNANTKVGILKLLNCERKMSLHCWKQEDEFPPLKTDAQFLFNWLKTIFAARIPKECVPHSSLCLNYPDLILLEIQTSILNLFFLRDVIAYFMCSIFFMKTI